MTIICSDRNNNTNHRCSSKLVEAFVLILLIGVLGPIASDSRQECVSETTWRTHIKYPFQYIRRQRLSVFTHLPSTHTSVSRLRFSGVT